MSSERRRLLWSSKSGITVVYRKFLSDVNRPVCIQVGDKSTDNAYFGRPETMNYKRRAYSITKDRPGIAADFTSALLNVQEYHNGHKPAWQILLENLEPKYGEL